MRFFASKRVILILLGLVWVELTILPAVAIYGIKPNLFFVFLVFYAFHVNYRSLVVLALLFGLVKDVYTNTLFGMETASYVISAALLEFVVLRLEREKTWIQWMSLFVFSWASVLIFSLLAVVIHKPYGVSVKVLRDSFFVALYTLFLGFAIFPLLSRWIRFGARTRQYELFK